MSASAFLSPQGALGDQRGDLMDVAKLDARKSRQGGAAISTGVDISKPLFWSTYENKQPPVLLIALRIQNTIKFVPSMTLFIASLNSGSNGNCYYVGNETERSEERRVGKECVP